MPVSPSSSSVPPVWDVVVLGAGAAGLMCAVAAGERGRRVLVVDHADRAGKKILISGGGRANFTNLHTTHSNYLSENPHFARSALARFTPADMVAYVERHGIAFHEKTLGQLFCDRSARDLVAALERDCHTAGVRLALGTQVGAVSRDQAGFTVESSAGPLRTRSLVVATGGLSIPKMGATGLGYDLAQQFGLRVVEPRPALVPFTFSAADCAAWCDLAGLAATTEARVERKGAPAFRERFLLTHRGLSGPAMLQASSYWQAGEAVRLDLAPGHDLLAPVRQGARRDPEAVLLKLREVLPARLAERWLAHMLPPGTPAGRPLSNGVLDGLDRALHGWTVRPAGTEGYGKAEVTAGGVATGELDPRTLEARAVPGLFFIGEVVDVTGWLGGYNFQWAWASGVCAGQSV